MQKMEKNLKLWYQISSTSENSLDQPFTVTLRSAVFPIAPVSNTKDRISSPCAHRCYGIPGESGRTAMTPSELSQS